MKTGTPKYFKAVLHEVKALRIHATEEERMPLDFDSLCAVSLTRCIYGQMTGFCYSDRAEELIELCTNGIYCTRIGDEYLVESALNRSNNFTPLEHCIVNYPEHNAKIIAYLRGERKTIRL